MFKVILSQPKKKARERNNNESSGCTPQGTRYLTKSAFHSEIHWKEYGKDSYKYETPWIVQIRTKTGFYGDPFVHGEVYSNSQLDDIGAYLMKDSNRGIMISAGVSTTLSFTKHRGDIEVGGGHDL